MSKTITIVYWITRIAAAIILLQTLYFKFSASEESVYIFTVVGMEPWGRIGIGTLELIAAALVLLNNTVWIGSALSAGLMAGAIMMHLTMLGIVVNDDGGYLFTLATIVLLCNIFALYINREKVMRLLRSVVKIN
jgi:hypothetical protein